MAWHGMACSREHTHPAAASASASARTPVTQAGLDSAFGETCTRTHRRELCYTRIPTIARTHFHSLSVRAPWKVCTTQITATSTTTTSPCLPSHPIHPHPHSAVNITKKKCFDKISTTRNPPSPFPFPTLSYRLDHKGEKPKKYLLADDSIPRKNLN